MNYKKLMTAALLAIALQSPAQEPLYVGGDLSVLSKYEEQGATYFDKDGKTITDVLAFVKEQGWNTIRVRLFVNPTGEDKAVCQDLAYVKKLGKRIKDEGLYFMLDFHYSDTWADPGQQTIPAAWNVYSWYPSQTIRQYTEDCLQELVVAGATPDLIQTGNEISFGMLWGFVLNGKYEDWDELGGHLEATSDWKGYTDKHWDNFSQMLKAAGEACRKVCPQAKIIIHTEQCANNPTLDVAFFKRIQQYEIDYDIIGVSYYPYFHGELSNLDKGLTQLERNFPEKKIQLVETGYPSKWAVPGTKFDYTETFYPYSPEGQRQYTAALITMLKKHQQVNGLNWWYAEANAKGCTGSLASGWYNAGLFDNETGRALPALYELKNYSNGGAGLSQISIDSRFADSWYTIDGIRHLSSPSKSGLYIHNGQKVAVK